MKKFVIGLLSLVAPMFGIASAMTWSYIAENPTCNEDESKTMDIYMTWDVYTIYPYDAYWNSENDVLINNKTSVQIWSDGTSVSGCYGDTWALMSNYVLKGKPSNQWDRTLLLRTKNQAGCVLHKPTKIRKNATDKNVIFHYTIWFKKVDNKKDTKLNEKFYYTTPNSSQYFCVADKQRKNNVSECSKMTVGYDPEQQYHLWECLNYRIFRCGDGILDNNNEECDPEAQPWKDDHSCDPVTCEEKNPVCDSEYNWGTFETLAAWKELCNVWTVKNFKYDDNTHTWTWECEAAWKGVECSAKKPYDWDFEVKKTLISESKYITKVWQELVWEIEVTATGGDVKNVEITDKLPLVLEYVSYTSTLPSWVTIAKDQPTFSDDKKTVHWETKWTLKSWESIVLKVVTKAVAMPKTTDNYKNVACAKAEWLDEDCKDVPIWTPNLRIKKYFSDAEWNNKSKETKTVKIWDTIWYRIDFGNSGNAEATITSIKDFLPKNVKYKSSKIVIEGVSIHSTGTQVWEEDIWNWHKIVDGVYIDIYGGITLQPWAQWYILIEGEILGDYQNNTTNFACIYLNDEKVECDDAKHTFTEEPVSCIPTLEPSSFADVCSSDTSSFSTTVTCKSSWNADIEILCDGVVVKTGHASLLTWTCSATTNNTDHRAQCKINGSLTWTDWKSCEASFRRNTKSCGGWGWSCFVAWTKVTMADGTQKNIEDVEIWEKVLWSNGTVNTVIWYDRPVLWNRHLWSINGSEYFVSDEHPFMTTEWWKSFNPEMTKLEVDLDTTELNVWDILVTDDGLEKIESVDYIVADYNTPLYNFVLDGDHTYYADNYLVHNKWWSGTPTCQSVTVKNGDVTCSASSDAYFKLQCGNKTYYSYNYRDGEKKVKRYTFEWVKCNNNNYKCSISKYDDEDWPWTSNSKCVKAVVPEGFEQCFNVNAWNFSIEEWEIFPFFWNMHNLEVWIDQNKEGDVDWYDTIKDTSASYIKAVNNYEDYKDTDCEKVWTIAKDSMVCTFKIYGWWETKPLYTIEWPCLSKESSLKKSNLIKAWYNTMIRTYCGDSSKCYFSLDPERKDGRALLPSAIYYIENFGSWTNVPLKLDVGWDFELFWNIHAESTKPYWEYRIVLDNVKYLQCIGDDENPTWQQTSPEDYFTPCQNNFVLTDPYTVQKTPSGNLTASTKKLDNYRYLSGSSVFSALLGAISASEYRPNSKVNDAMDAFIKKYEKLAVSVNVWNSSFLEWNNIKKVPWKSIYFVKGNITIKWNNQSIDKPFTIVQTEGKTTIKWNVKHNMMLLTNGDIVFQWNNCTEDQTVKWIFYAAGNLSRAIKYRNNKSDATTWCTKGWLHVQWVLIGNGFEGLMNNSRSHLNDWFDKDSLAEKKQSVMNGASVLIEYSPSIFTKSTMPPGAEDFTTALTIYKQ